MNRLLIPCLVFTLGVSAVAEAQPAPPPETESSSPAWLPRGVYLGTFIRGGALAPQARLNWQVPFFRGRTDTLSLLIEPLAAVTAAFPSALEDENRGTLASLQLYSLVAGVAYRSRHEEGLEWGFQIGTGPAWYSARFTGAAKDSESYFVGLLDGRAQIGYNFGRISAGVVVGYGDPYNYKRTSLSHPFVGGLHLGLYSEWR
jgi:hypothetical protein